MCNNSRYKSHTARGFKFKQQRRSWSPLGVGVYGFVIQNGLGIRVKIIAFSLKKLNFLFSVFRSLNVLKGICVVYTTQIPLRPLRLIKLKIENLVFLGRKQLFLLYIATV